MHNRSLKKITVITPFYNEADTIDAFFENTLPVLHDLGCEWEILCVEDGSEDASFESLKHWHLKDSRIRVLKLSRNFGKDPAIAAGFDHATGDAVVAMDADLQDPPSIIPAMIRAWEQGAEVVGARRQTRAQDSRFKRSTSRWFYRLFNALSNLQIPENVGDFQLLDRRVVENLKRFPERRRFMRGIFAFLGFKQAFVDFERPARIAGKTKWNYWKLWNFAIDGITSFSITPLRLWSYLGALICLAALLYAFGLIAAALFLGVENPGYAPVTILVLLLGGLNMVALGTVGEYIGRIAEEVRGRPLYLIDEVLGIQNKTEKKIPKRLTNRDSQKGA
jgi:polyisoprenyl-phosphate glycosyltransferase